MSSLDDFDLGDEFEEGSPLPEESRNRTFLIALGIMGAIGVLALVCIAVYTLVWLPQSRKADQAYQATVDQQNTEVALIINQTSTQAALQAAYTYTPTQTSMAATPTATSSPTSVLVQPQQTDTPTLAPEMATATALHATLTANAELFAATLTARATLTVHPTGIPDTGLMDDVGLPMLLGMAFLLIVVIFLARRLRTA